MRCLFSCSPGLVGASRDSILPTRDALRSARDIIRHRMKATSWLHSDVLADFFVRELARTRNGCSEARLKSVLGETLLFRTLVDELVDELIAAEVLRVETLSQIERFELLSIHGSSDGEWMLLLAAEGWSEVHSSLYAALAETSVGPTSRDELLTQMEREFEKYELDSPAAAFANQAFDLLWMNGAIRGRRSALIGDPRPMLYLRLDARWRAQQAAWHERAVEAARTAFDPNPYSPHLVAFLDVLPSPDEIEALPWVLRTWQLPSFDTAAVVLDVTEWVLGVAEVGEALTAIQRSCALATVPLRLLVRAQPDMAKWRQLTSIARACSDDANTTVVWSLAGDAWSPTWLEDARGEIVFSSQAAALQQFHDAGSPHLLAQCFRSLLTGMECAAGDTVTLSMNDHARGCPMCARGESFRASTDDIARARSILRARDVEPFSGYVPATRNDRPFGRRSCV